MGKATVQGKKIKQKKTYVLSFKRLQPHQVQKNTKYYFKQIKDGMNLLRFQNFIPVLLFFVLWSSEDIKELDGPLFRTIIYCLSFFVGSMDVDKVTDAIWVGTDPSGDQKISGFYC